MAQRRSKAAMLLLATSLCAGSLFLLSWARPSKASSKPWPADKPPTEAENRAAAKSAKPILDAIYGFKRKNGLWPNDLDELIPEYIKKKQVAGWRYTTRQDGYWRLINYAGFPHTAVQYRYLKRKGGQWELSWGDGEAKLKVPYTPPVLKKLAPEDVTRRMRETVLQRIRLRPKQVVHHKGLVSTLYRKKQFKEAKQACLKCLERWPDLWWPNVMLSLIEVHLNRTKEGEERLLAWVKKHGDFHHWFFAAHFYEATGEKVKCAAALRKAARSPLDTLWVEWEDTGENFGSLSGESSAWYAALIAYRAGRLDVCLEVCDRWERYIKHEQEYGAPGFNVFQAACYLNQGKVDKAKRAIEAALDPEGPNYGYQFDKEIARLRKAIKARDRKFRYTPCRHIIVDGRDVEEKDKPDNWELLVDYE
jgi:tetratricopeptide (TPR) repeat protein